jgi:hypothetical protein
VCYSSHPVRSGKRVFKTKSFTRWARGLLSDAALCEAALEIEQGIYEADLGHGVCKKRIALPGEGKRSGTRTLVAKQHGEAIIFLVGREKSDAGSDFSDLVVAVTKRIASGFHKQSLEGLEEQASNGELKEICNDQKIH